MGLMESHMPCYIIVKWYESMVMKNVTSTDQRPLLQYDTLMSTELKRKDVHRLKGDVTVPPNLR